jgi:hypothetical protein
MEFKMNFNIINTVANQPSLNAFFELVGDASIKEMEDKTPAELKAIIQQAGLANLLIPSELGGQALSLVEGLEIIQAVATRCPSAALMLCMHYHVVVTLAQFVEMLPSGFDILSDVGQNNALVASAFAEGIPGKDIFDSGVKALQTEQCIRISGSKKPCTLSSVADYYAVSINDHEDASIGGVAFVRQGQKGVEVVPFWPTELVQAADSNEVKFNDVEVANTDVILAPIADLADLLGYGLATFNLMTSCAYTGVAQALTNKLSDQVVANPTLYVDINGQLLQTHYATVGLAATLEAALAQGADPEQLVNTVLLLRYKTQSSIKSLVVMSNENMGGMKYLFDAEVIMLSNVANLLSFHPVTRGQFEQQLMQQIKLTQQQTAQ